MLGIVQRRMERSVKEVEVEEEAETKRQRLGEGEADGRIDFEVDPKSTTASGGEVGVGSVACWNEGGSAGVSGSRGRRTAFFG